MPQKPELPHDQTVFEFPPRGARPIGTPEEVQHTIVMLDPDGPIQRRIPIGPTPLTVGRIPSCDITLDGSSVSRAHCVFEMNGDQLVVTDLNSRNGTFVDGKRLVGSAALHHGAVVQVASHLLAYERHTRREIEEAAALDRDLQEASAYVQSLLPQPIGGGRVRAEWLFLPCAQLGGSGFGYRYLDETTFAAYIIDVPGQGTSAAMQSVALMNLLGQPAGAGMNFRNPREIMTALNDMYRNEHKGTFFSIWYGVFDTLTRTLQFSSAGHHPGFLSTPSRTDAMPLSTFSRPIGLESDAFTAEQISPEPGSTLCLLSDGACEIVEKNTEDAPRFLAELLQGTAAEPGSPEPLRLYQAVRQVSGADVLEEDFLAVVFAFD